MSEKMLTENITETADNTIDNTIDNTTDNTTDNNIDNIADNTVDNTTDDSAGDKTKKKRKAKKSKKDKEKKISNWFIGIFTLFFIILAALNMILFVFVIDGIITLGNVSILESETAYISEVISYDEMDDENAYWIELAKSYFPKDKKLFKLYGTLQAVYTLKPGQNNDLIYGAGTWCLEEQKKKAGDTVSYEDMSAELQKQILDLEPDGNLEFDFESEKDGPREIGLIYAYPITDDDGVIHGYLVAEEFGVYQKATLIGQQVIFSFLFAFFETMILSVFVIILYQLIKKRIISPLKQVRGATKEFVEVSRNEDDPSKWVFNKPTLKKRDEIESVNDSVACMAQDMTGFMQTILDEAKEKQRIGTELELAAQIQMGALETRFPAFPNITNVDIFAQMTPAKEVGGDFYDFFPVDDTHIGLVMADVSGKGVPASIYMMIAKIILRQIAMMGDSPKDTLIRLNDQISDNNQNAMFVTIWFGILDVTTGHVVAANAGHEYPIIKAKNGKYEVMKDKHGLVLGAMSGIKYREYEFDIEKGGALFLYTDGAPEATNAENELYGMDRVVESLNKNPELPAKELIESLKVDIDEFVGDAPQFDDLTMMSVRMLEN